MLLAVASLLVVVSVPLARGRLGLLADLRLRARWLLFSALFLQVIVLEVARHLPAAPELHVVSYLLVGGFLWVNRAVPGMRLVALGAGMNAAAILANGGVMPASADALAVAGLDGPEDGFSNSVALADPRLAVLGDIFAVPRSWPFANVFSVGDVLLVAGLATGLHRICESRLMPYTARSLGSLRDNRAFKSIWLAQGLSSAGDWVYTMAVFTIAAGRDGTTELLAALLVAQMAPSALTGALAGGLVDRVPRRTLMLGADAARAAAVASLLIAPHPSAAHFLGVAVMLGACGALFAPSVQAAIPGLVSDADLVRANAVLATTQNATIVLAPLAGGFIVAQLGASTAFALNGLSFVASAILVAYAGLPRSAASAAEVARSPIRMRGRAPASVVARGFAAAGAVLMVGAAIKTPVEPALVLDVLAERAEVLGVVTAVWGVGMIAGSSGAHALARLVPLDRLFAGAVTLVGVCVLAGALAPGVLLLLALWLAAGFGNGVGGVVFDTLLQRHSPEAIRGRIAAITEAAMDFGYLAGAAAAAALATMTGPRGCLVASGVLFLASAGAWRLASASIRPLAATPPEPPDEPAPRGALAPVHP